MEQRASVTRWTLQLIGSPPTAAAVTNLRANVYCTTMGSPSTLVIMASILTMAIVVAVASAARASSYQNPVYAGDFADPFVLPVDGAYYAYAYVERQRVRLARAPCD